VSAPGASLPASQPVVGADSSSGNGALRQLLGLPPGTPGALTPGGWDDGAAIDAPLAALLQDARVETARLIGADTTCRNTVVVLLAAGGDPSVADPVLGAEAAALLAVGGRRVPAYVVALAPTPDDAARLRAVARRSGGQYFEIGAATIDRVPASEPVPEIVAALHAAIQHAFAAFADFNALPSDMQPYGPPSYFPTVGPVVGTVNLANALDAAGNLLPSTRLAGPGGEVLLQTSNVLFTAGFDLPGFFGRLSAFRVYRPVVDPSRPSGYRFSSDGTLLWTARPPDPEQRNIFTVLPGAGVVPFRSSSAAALAPYLGVRDAVALIGSVRSLPLGPSLNSTPALLEPPSGRFADLSYLAFTEANRGRRSLVFAGADDGMMHAFDARTGIEIWAVIPFNLLPKLRRLREGLPLDAFPYGVEGSPRLADVQVSGAWRTYLLFGEGPGGTFYQAFDVTLDHLADIVPPDADALPPLLAWFADASRIPFAWSFPRYSSFGPDLSADGDLRSAADEAERSVGETWSTPAVGRAGDAFGRFVAVVGSGPLARSREAAPNRGGARAGTRVYVLDMGSGVLLDARDVGSDGIAEEQDGCPAEGCSRLKNAIQADPIADQDDQGAIHSVYAGDLDGRLWRFALSSGASPGFAGGPVLLFSASADQPIFGSVARLAGSAGQSYLFFGTGSELLPRGAVAPPQRVVGLSESPNQSTTRFELLLRSAAADGAVEGMAGAPVVAGSVVFFATTSRGESGGCAPAESSLYALNVAGGVAYDANGDRRRDSADVPVVSRLRAGRSSTPAVADRHLFVATGDRMQVFGDPDGFALGLGARGLRILSWREVRAP
jgi:outer membrane protein assembly factor BamB